MSPLASWSLHDLTDPIVFIVDNDNGCMSVTNAAEEVCADCFRHFGDRRIVYRDTMGNWDELKHEKGHFTGFAPYKGKR